MPASLFAAEPEIRYVGRDGVTTIAPDGTQRRIGTVAGVPKVHWNWS